MQKSRGVLLTIFALLFVLLAISDFAKPLSHSPGVGFVFMGVRQSGLGICCREHGSVHG